MNLREGVGVLPDVSAPAPAPTPNSTESPTVTLAACPVCDASALAALPVPGHWIGEPVFAPHRDQLGLSQCERCAFVFTNPRPSTALLEAFYTGPTYACHGITKSSQIERKARFILGLFEKYQPACGRRFLDYGCGGGWLLKYGNAHGWSGAGFDVGGRAVETCRSQGLEVSSDLDALPEATFDVIMLNHVFEHLEHPSETLRQLRRLLAPSGRILIEVPNADSLRARLSPPIASRRFRFDERYRAYPIHLSYFSPTTLKRLLERCDLEVVATETYGLGVDELLADAEAAQDDPYPERGPRQAAGDEANASPSAVMAALRFFKHLVKRTLFGAGLGENLLAVARLRPH